jgi:hypothetical protein
MNPTMTEYDTAVLAQLNLRRAQDAARASLAKLSREDREAAKREASDIFWRESVEKLREASTSVDAAAHAG